MRQFLCLSTPIHYAVLSPIRKGDVVEWLEDYRFPDMPDLLYYKFAEGHGYVYLSCLFVELPNMTNEEIAFEEEIEEAAIA